MLDKSLILDLVKYDIIKFGEFKLKSGAMSPIYINLRNIISYPELLSKISGEYIKLIENKGLDFDRIAGIAYGALGIAFNVANSLTKPVILVKKEDKKDYGIKSDYVGVSEQDEKIIIIEDIATTGGSAIDVAEKLKTSDLQITDAVVFLDRQAGAEQNFKEKGITMHSVVTINDMLEILKEENAIEEDMYKKVKEFLNK